MDIDLTLMFFEKFKDDNMSLLYSGDFSDEVTTKFIDISEHNIESIEEQSKMKRKVSFLMAECFQNVVRHGEITGKNDDKGSPGFFLTKNIGRNFFISSGNLINKNSIDDLEDQLNKVNSLNRNELKKLYRKVIDDKQFSNKGGAGLGLIDMARKSGEKIDYSFNDFDNDYSIFYNQIQLRASDTNDTPDRPYLNINESIDFHKVMSENDLLLVQKGDFSYDMIIPLLNVIEQNLEISPGKSWKNSAVYHSLAEILQNIGNHSFMVNNRKEGIVLIGKNESDFIIMSGNYVETSMVPKLKKRLDKIKKLNKVDLKSLYIRELSKAKNKDKKAPCLGLIDIAGKSSESIKYKFKRIDQSKVFFSIKVTV